MKHLQDFINEAMKINEASESKSVTFNFTDLENADETIESLKDKEGVTVDDKKVTLTLTKDNVDKIGTVQDILQQFCQTVRNSEKRTNDEQYAQKTKSFEEKIGEMNDAIDELTASDEEDKEDKDKDKNKE